MNYYYKVIFFVIENFLHFNKIAEDRLMHCWNVRFGRVNQGEVEQRHIGQQVDKTNVQRNFIIFPRLPCHPPVSLPYLYGPVLLFAHI